MKSNFSGSGSACGCTKVSSSSRNTVIFSGETSGVSDGSNKCLRQTGFFDPGLHSERRPWREKGGRVGWAGGMEFWGFWGRGMG
ncbi:hypothetical protein C1H46_002747 [Malus baccata]|uniref:Uncharacterized protein n=1 Tax=Malus baccata TaxID=106549 RepID=A0A540NL04_MALBA|nr:hypothetical protein C1H46_002747 [Malus baccata]